MSNGILLEDFYIIPLTQKLKDCGVFGVSSDEVSGLAEVRLESYSLLLTALLLPHLDDAKYLNYARKNREEWEARGEEVVSEMIEICRKKYGVKTEPKQYSQADIDC